jgi:hypothetical protein
MTNTVQYNVFDCEEGDATKRWILQRLHHERCLQKSTNVLYNGPVSQQKLQ